MAVDAADSKDITVIVTPPSTKSAVKADDAQAPEASHEADAPQPYPISESMSPPPSPPAGKDGGVVMVKGDEEHGDGGDAALKMATEQEAAELEAIYEQDSKQFPCWAWALLAPMTVYSECFCLAFALPLPFLEMQVGG